MRHGLDDLFDFASGRLDLTDVLKRFPAVASSIRLLRHVLWTALLACLVALLAGTASAWFLFALEWATASREAHPALIWGLPLAGALVSWIYLRVGQDVEAGNNLLIDQVHDPRKVVPLRMAPLIFGATVVSHFFGASVGREGTAVQMGGSLADQLTHVFRLKPEDRRMLLMAGISAGFSSVFGTPLAGAVFGFEVLVSGRLRYEALLPCLVSAVLADRVASAWGVQHTLYASGELLPIAAWPLLAVFLAALVFGSVARLFALTTHAAQAAVKRHLPHPLARPLLGGLAIAATIWATDGWRYAGLGIPTLVASFQQALDPWVFAGKFGFTVASLASGFKGGEVTPLFFIGATLGNALAPLLHLPVPMLAALGFVAVFAGAANTPLACTLMAIELFGSQIGIYAALACTVSYVFSGHRGIYGAQRLGHPKHGPDADAANGPPP